MNAAQVDIVHVAFGGRLVSDAPMYTLGTSIVTLGARMYVRHVPILYSIYFYKHSSDLRGHIRSHFRSGLRCREPSSAVYLPSKFLLYSGLLYSGLLICNTPLTGMVAVSRSILNATRAKLHSAEYTRQATLAGVPSS